MNVRHRSGLARGAAAVAGAALVVTGITAPASAQERPRDLMFSIDTTSSMSGYIGQVKIAVNDLATDLASSTAGTRVGLVEYRDDGDAFQSRTVTPLTSDVSVFSADLDALRVQGGGDTPESVYSGIARSLCESWNGDAVKAVIAIGDATAKDPEPVTGLTADRIIALANGTATDNPYCSPASVRATAVGPTAVPAGGVKVFVLSENSALTEQLQRIADETGGMAVPVEDIDDIADAIKDTIDTIDEDADTGGGLFGSLEGSLENLFGSSGS